MIEYHLDFDGDWNLWQQMCRKFRQENGYFELTEMPGWVRATEPFAHDLRIFENDSKSKVWAILYFKSEQDLTAFLLRWA